MGNGLLKDMGVFGETGNGGNQKNRRPGGILAGLLAVLKKAAKMLAGLMKMMFSTPQTAIISIMVIVVLLIGLMVGVSERTSKISSRTVALGLRNIGELATQSASYTNVQVIEDAREVWGMEIPFTQSKYIFSYDGVIKAGMDFSEIDVETDDRGKKFTVTLPQAQILSNEIDTDSLMVYDETRNIFTPLYLEDVNESLQKMKEESEETVIANGVLIEASNNAKVLIKSFLHGINGDYEVIFE